jgi:hypothetical protein
MPARLKIFLACTTLILLGVAGCAPTKNDTTDLAGAPQQLHEIATILPLYCGEHKRGPEKVADLAPYQTAAPLGYNAVVANEIVIVWGATMPGEGEGGGTDAVVAYESKVPTTGGWVLLQNGKVIQMTADQFKAAPKAAP